MSGKYEGAEYVVLVSGKGSARRSRAHLEDLERLGFTLCGKSTEHGIHRSGEDVCLTCNRIAG